MRDLESEILLRLGHRIRIALLTEEH